MPTRKLTDAGVKNLPVPEDGQVDYFDTLVPAFGVRLSYGGARTWFVTTRIAGKGKVIRLKVGRYPDLPLSDAREKARGFLELASRGVDPRLVRQDEIADNARKAALTFGVVSDDFLVRYAEKRLRPVTIQNIKAAFKHVVAWRDRPVSEISRRDVLDVVEGLEDSGKGVAADRVFAYLRKFFNWCVERDILESAPTDRIRRSSNSVARHRVLSLDELRLAWAAFDSLGYPFGPLFKLLALTGQRKAEIGRLEWSELRDWSTDMPLLDLPPERVKNNRAHLVPIVPAAKALLEGCHRIGRYVFTTTGETPVSGYSRAKVAVDAHMLAALRKRAEKAGDDPDKVVIPHWTLHDLRRTMVTHMNERLGVPPHVVEAIINHVSGTRAGVAGVYNRALYLDDRRDALERWARKVGT